MERLKEINRVARAGSNVEGNVDRAVEIAVRDGRLARPDGDFLKRRGSTRQTFRTPGDGVNRSLPLVPPEEMELAVLHILEDQFGYQRDALPRRVGELFVWERAPVGLAELIGTVVDNLIVQKLLVLSGHHVYLA